MKFVQKISTRVRVFLRAEVGASLVEYALLVALIALVAVVAVRFFGTELSDSYQTIADSIP